MKKIVLFTLLIAASVLGVNAQGTWKAPAYGTADGDKLTVVAGAPLETGIQNLVVNHNFGQSIVNKNDGGAPAVTLNGVTYDNQTIIQAGGENGQYFIFQPSVSGTLDICGKMGGGKKNIVLETAKTPAELSGFLVKNIVAGIDDESFPTVTSVGKDADGNVLTIETKTWDGTTAINPGSANQFIIMSFPVTAGKNYVVGVDGSKFMLVGIHYEISGGASIPVLDAAKEIKSVQYFDVLGKEVSADATGLVIVKTTYTDGTTSAAKTIKKIY